MWFNSKCHKSIFLTNVCVSSRFSTDEGQCWYTYKFTDKPMYFTGLASEPGARSVNVSLWGYEDAVISHWVSYTIDFQDLLTRTCEWTVVVVEACCSSHNSSSSGHLTVSSVCLSGGTNDYVEWLAHSDDISDPDDGCMLGYKERFLRLRKDSLCWIGRDYVVTKEPTPCSCTLDDFLWWVVLVVLPVPTS